MIVEIHNTIEGGKPYVKMTQHQFDLLLTHAHSGVDDPIDIVSSTEPKTPETSSTPGTIDIVEYEDNGVATVKMTKSALQELTANIAIESEKAAAATLTNLGLGDVTKAVSSTQPEFTDIDNEEYRTYHFPDDSEYTIAFPVKLNVKRKPEGDSHRLIDSDGVAHYVRAGWIAITWRDKNGGPGYKF